MDDRWEAFVNIALPIGPVREQRSRYADKPALYLGTREIAHCEAPGHIDLRVTRRAWTTLRADWLNDPAIVASPGRRDWIELAPASAHDLARLAPLIAAAVIANQGANQ